ncbi:MAG: transglycosylase SLT domain-containing protein [Candidatus Gracilibacteria bacterium]
MSDSVIPKGQNPTRPSEPTVVYTIDLQGPTPVVAEGADVKAVTGSIREGVGSNLANAAKLVGDERVGNFAVASAVAYAAAKALTRDKVSDLDAQAVDGEEIDANGSVPDEGVITEPVRPSFTYSEVGKIVSSGKYEDKTGTGDIQARFTDLFRDIFEKDGEYAFYFDKYGNLLLQVEFPQNLKENRANIRLLRDEMTGKMGALSSAKKKDKEKLRKEITQLTKALSDLKAKNKAETQEWHNQNRLACQVDGETVIPKNYDDLGYPFVHTTILSEEEYDENPGLTIKEVVLKRLEENVSSNKTHPIYFNGEQRNLYDAIIEIATAYDVPRAIALGIPANESMFRKKAESEADAKGIYQFTKDGFEQAKRYAQGHPEFGRKLRSESIGNYNDSWPNRFVSAELFCAYYRSIKDSLKDNISSLEERIKKLDPSLPSGTFGDLVAMTAYNAGPGRTKRCLARFTALSDEQIKQIVGEPPYGVDVWIGLIAYSFGMKMNGESTGVGADVFMYSQKAIAMGSIIRDEENMLEVLNRDKPGFSTELKPDASENNGSADEHKDNQSSGKRNWLRTAFGLLAVTSAATAGASIAAKRQSAQGGLTRRDVLKGLVAVGAAASLPFGSGKATGKDKQELGADVDAQIPETGDEVGAEYVYNQTLVQGSKKLDAVYADLRRRIKDRETGGIMSYTPDESDDLRRYLMPQQTALLRGRFKDMLGDSLESEFERMTTAQIRRKVRGNPNGDNMLRQAQEKQGRYIAEQVDRGEVIRLSENDSKKPYFCEQVGSSSGSGNNPENMLAGKEMEKIMGTLVTLVNHQIDIFNGDKVAYGITDKNFPALPRISAIRVTGALRTPQQSLNYLQRGLPATLDLSSHWAGRAIDLASKKSANGNMVRLADDLVDPTTGIQFRAGEKLPNGGYGKRTREIYSHMIGRALFAMEIPLKTDGIVLQPLWEQGQRNWHLTWDSI